MMNFAHELEVLNSWALALISKDVSRFVSQEYVNTNSEPFMAGSMTF